LDPPSHSKYSNISSWNALKYLRNKVRVIQKIIHKILDFLIFDAFVKLRKGVTASSCLPVLPACLACLPCLPACLTCLPAVPACLPAFHCNLMYAQFGDLFQKN
jgi:hypothetical protein